MSEKKKVIVFTTGGTIAMKFDPKVNGLVPAVSGADLAAAVPGLDKLADVEVREFSNHASCAMTPQKMFQLSQMIEEALKEEGVAGAVVTHGTRNRLHARHSSQERKAYCLNRCNARRRRYQPGRSSKYLLCCQNSGQRRSQRQGRNGSAE